MSDIRIETAEKLAFTIDEAAVILSCCPKTVRKLCKEGKIRSVALGPRARRIPRSVVQEYISGKTKD